jgi:hypothetical protein
MKLDRARDEDEEAVGPPLDRPELMSDFLLVAASFTLSRSDSRVAPSPTAYALTNGVSNPETVPYDIQTFPFWPLTVRPDFHQLTAASDDPKF